MEDASCNPGGILGEARLARSPSRCTTGERGTIEMKCQRLESSAGFCRLGSGLVQACSGLFRLGGRPRDTPRRSDSDKLPLDSTDSTVTCQRPLSVWPLSAVHLPAAVQLLVHRDMIGVISQPASQPASQPSGVVIASVSDRRRTILALRAILALRGVFAGSPA
jgi:hypothetical protein